MDGDSKINLAEFETGIKSSLSAFANKKRRPQSGLRTLIRKTQSAAKLPTKKSSASNTRQRDTELRQA